MSRRVASSSQDARGRALENERRMRELGVDASPLYRHYQILGLSPLRKGSVAERFGRKLSGKLDSIEFARAMNPESGVHIPEMCPEESVLLGHTLSGDQPYPLHHNALPQHIVCNGASGSGKTVFAFGLTLQLSGRFDVTLFDHKDEGPRFAAKIPRSVYLPLTRQRWNLLQAGRDQAGHMLHFAQQSARVAALAPVTTHATSAVLQRLCTDPDNIPAVADLGKIFHELASRESRHNLHSAAKGFDDLSLLMGDWARVRKEPPGFFKSHRLTILQRKDLPPVLEVFFSGLLFKRFMDEVTAEGHSLTINRIFIFDEGRGFFGEELEAGAGSGRQNLQTELTTKCRSYRFPLIINTQSASKLQSSVLDNAATYVALRTNSEREAKFNCRRFGLPDERYREFMELETGTAFVVSPTCPVPVKIRIPNNDLGEYPSDAATHAAMSPIWKAWDEATVFAEVQSGIFDPIDFRDILGETHSEETPPEEVDPEDPANSEPPLSGKTAPKILDESLALLRSCRENPEHGVMAHYRSLGWSAGRGHRIKTELIDAGWLKSARITSPTGGRPRESLRLTAQGERILDEHA